MLGGTKKCVGRTGFSLFFKLSPDLRISDVILTRFLELIGVLFIMIWVPIAIYNVARYSPIEEVPTTYQALLVAGVTDLAHDGQCSCQNTSFPAAVAYTYQLQDSDYAYCDGPFYNLTSQWGSLTCETSTYKIYGSINQQQWMLGGTQVLTESQLRATLINRVSEVVFDDWNIETDALREAGLIAAMEDLAVEHNITKFNIRRSVLSREYYKMNWIVWYHLDGMTARIVNLTTVNYQAYLETCRPTGCIQKQKVPQTSGLYQIPSSLGGTIGLMSTVFGAIIAGVTSCRLKPMVAYFKRKYRNKEQRLEKEDDTLLKIISNNTPDHIVPIMWEHMVDLQKRVGQLEEKANAKLQPLLPAVICHHDETICSYCDQNRAFGIPG